MKFARCGVHVSLALGAGTHSAVWIAISLTCACSSAACRSTLWEIYTSTATDNQAMDLLVPNSVRAPVNEHRVSVRMAALAQITSAQADVVSGGLCCSNVHVEPDISGLLVGVGVLGLL
jgi:hypothetical protein